MPVYHLIGTTMQGKKIQEEIEAENRDEVLKQIPKIYGRLRSNFEIYTLKQLENLEEYPLNLNTRKEPIMSDQEVIEFAKRINVVTTDEWNLFHIHFSPMLKAAIRELWNDIVIETPEEKEVELLDYIVRKVIPRFDPTRGMTLRAFFKLNIRNKLINDWNRRMYVNSNSGFKRRRREAEIEAGYQQLLKPEKVDREEQRLIIIGVGKKIAEEQVKLIKSNRLEFFSEVVSLGLHKEFLKSPVQILTLDLTYGEKFMNGEEIAELRGIKPQSVNETRKSAERNILRYIKKFF